MQYQPHLSEGEARTSTRSDGTGTRGELKDPFGRTLEVARDQDRARYTVRRRNFVARLARTAGLYRWLYNGVIGIGLGGALGAFGIALYGVIAFGWPIPSTLGIFTYAAALGLFPCLLERTARWITRTAMNWIRRVAEAEGIDLDSPEAPWHTRAVTRPRRRRSENRHWQ